MQFVKDNCRHLEVPPSRIKPGDIVLLGLIELKCETVQTECYRVENLKPFVSWLLRDSAGKLYHLRGFDGRKKVEVYRAKR